MTEQVLFGLHLSDRSGGGPLDDDIVPFAARLKDQGYDHDVARRKVRLLADASRWLRQRGLGVASFDEQGADAFVRYRRRRLLIVREDRGTLRAFIAQLRATGRLPARILPPVASIQHPAELEFRQYLTQERGISASSVHTYGRFVRIFLSECFGSEAVDLGKLSAEDVRGHLLRQIKIMGRKNAKMMGTALRSFFRFLYLRGETSAPLAGVVPNVAHWRLSTIPLFLKSQDVERVLNACDHTTPAGRRDHAVLLLLARLGLRAGEVLRLRLEDIHWEAGEVSIDGKGGQIDRMPLPHEVGQALATYLRQPRPVGSSRRVFVTVIAPFRTVRAVSTISSIVARAFTRAGLSPPLKGAHVFRHSLATNMLSHGASLQEVAQVLRHRALSTTQIYAKVNMAALRPLAQVWPGDKT